MTLRVGICDGRPRKHSLAIYKQLFPTDTLDIKNVGQRNEHIVSNDNIVFFIKPKDMAVLLHREKIDCAIGCDDTMYHLPEKNYDLKPAYSISSATRICLIKKPETVLTEESKLVSEYSDCIEYKSIFKKLYLKFKSVESCVGKAENYVQNGLYDAAIVIVDTGETIAKMGLDIVQEISKVNYGAWCNVNNEKSMVLYTQFKTPKYLYIDGIDGSGKTTLVKTLKQDGKYKEFIIKDRSILTDFTLMHQSEWPKKNTFLGPDDVVVILNVDPVVCVDRIKKRGLPTDKWESLHWLHYFKRIYMALAFHYQLVLVNNDFHLNALKLPDTLEQTTCGESKIIYKWNDEYELIKLIPSVYSHKKQRAAIIDDTDTLRYNMSRNMLHLISMDDTINELPHNWLYIGDFDGTTGTFIVAKKLNIKEDYPVEVVVKTKWCGTDKHRYTGFEKYLVTDCYPEKYVRFDWRNPNSHPEGDVCISERLLGLIGYDTIKTGDSAIKVFDCMQSILKSENIRLDDICFFMTQDGFIYSEISQDNARYKLIDENKVIDLDKDVFRSGGSSDLVYQKYAKLDDIVKAKTISELKRIKLDLFG